jgi:fibronectin-binding autotransporter adhesin
MIPLGSLQAQVEVVYNTTGNSTFNVPVGVKEIRVQVWGAGGGGRINDANTTGGGGGGGAYAEARFQVVSGDSYTLTVGAGGIAGNNGGLSRLLGNGFDFTAGGGFSGAIGLDPSPPGTATFTSGTFITSAQFSGGSGGAGIGGGGNPGDRRAGGGGGSGFTTAIGGDGQNGGNGSGGAGGTGQGNGGNGGFGGTPGGAGSVPGGGGGGKGTAGSGGSGANGRIIVSYQLLSAANTNVSANVASVLANGQSASTITVQVRDTNNNPINNLVAGDFEFTGTGAAVVGGFSDLGSGNYTFLATNTTVQTVNISVEVLEITVGSTGNISYTLPTPNTGNSTVLASPTVVPATGVASSTLTLQVFDNDNIPISNLVSGDFNFSGQSSASIIDFTNVGGGTYTFRVTNTVAQTINITASARSSTIGSSGNIEFIIATALYSFKSGAWNDPETWTEDPSGTTAINQAAPDDNYFVTILVGRTVTLTENVTAVNLNLFIEEGGVLDFVNFTTTTLNTLEGGGRLRTRNIVSGTPDVAYFPSVTNNLFIGPNGGTVEYYQQGNITLPTTIANYRNLRLTNATASSYTFTQSSNIQLFGNLTVTNSSSGSLTLQLGNNTTAREMIIGGNVTISAGSVWQVGNFNANHTVQIGGDLVNNGQFIMTRRAEPVGWPSGNPGYSTAPSEGRAEVRFTSARNNKIDAFGVTRFYRLVVDKGIDQTDILTVNSSNQNNFQIFGQNNQNIANEENPESEKALFIRNGTLRLRDNIIIPSLTEGVRDFVINKNAALWIDGATVYTTLNGGGNTALTVIGKLRVSGSSYFDTRSSAGIIFQRDAEVIVEGGELRMSQFRPSGLVGNHRAAFSMTGGLMIVDGNGENGGSDGRFSMRFEDNSFLMSGGEIRVSQPTITTLGNGIDIRVNEINQEVTGGTWRVIAPTGTNDFRINSSAPFFNLFIEKEGTGAADTRLDQDLVILNNLTIESGVFQATSDFNVTVGANFDLQTGATYTPNNNTTRFNGAAAQTFTVSGTLGSSGLYNLVIDKSADTLTVAGSAATIHVRNDFSLTSGGLNDGGKEIEIFGNIVNSGTHKGSGKLILNPNGNRSISGNGSGRFGNLALSGPASDVVFTSNVAISVDGELSFVANANNQRILDMGSRLLRLTELASVAGFNEFRYVRTAGTSSSNGVTKAYGSALTFTWPIGVGTKYTPATITLSAAPTQTGSINLRTVSDTHPAVEESDRALNHYWRVNATDFVLGSALLTKTFNYLDADLGATIAASESDLAPAYYLINSNQWSIGQTSAINTTSNTITFSGILFETTLSGDYTAGDVTEPAPFITLDVYYSRTSGNWFTPSTWSTVGHAGPADVGVVPNAGSIVIVGSNHTVTVNADDALSAYLSILEDATVDVAATTGHNFGVAQGPSFGTLRVGSNNFPAGDLLEFLENGTTVYYRNGADFTLPASSPTISNLNSYYNLVIDSESGNLTMPDLDISVLNNLTINGTTSSNHARFGSGSNAGLNVDGNFIVESGSFRYRFAGTNTRIIDIKGNLEISSGAEFGFYDNTTNLIHSLIVGGNLVNNGTLDLQNNANRHIRLVFSGAENKSFSGSGAITYTRLEVDKGSSKTPTLTYSNTGTRTAADNAYILTNGTLSFARPGTFIVSNTASDFTLVNTTGITADHENAIVRIGYNNNNAADLVLRGRLEVKQGLVEIGNSANNVNNDIIYAGAGSPELIVSGGVLDVNGQIRRSTANVAGALNFRQSGSSITRIRGRNATDSRGMLEITNEGSFFELKDDALIQIYRGGSITYADFYVRPTSFNVTGGTVLFSPTGVGSNQNYLLDVTTEMYNITVENAGGNVATLNQQINNLVILNNLLIGSEAVYNSSDLNIFIGGRFTRMADASFNPGDNNVTFTGNAAEISGDFTSDSFFDLTVAQNANLTLLTTTPLRIRRNLTINTGATFDDGNNLISLLGNVTSNGTHISFENNSTSGIEFIGTGTQTISGTGVYGNLNINTTALVTLAGNIEVVNRLSMTQNLLNIADRRITFGVTGEVTNYSAARYLRSNGVLSDGGVRKRFPSGAAVFEFPVGVFGKYTPATIDITASTASGTVTIKPVNVKQPSHRITATNLLNYYWNVQSTGFNNETGLEVSHVYNYLQGDVAGDESIFVGGRYLFPNWVPLLGLPGTVDIAANKLELDDVSYIRGDYTAGEPDEFAEVSTYYSRDVACDAPTGCNWNDYDAVEEVYTAWSTTGHDGDPATSIPNGEPVIIKSGHRVIANGNTRQSESMQLNGTAEIDLEDYFSHNFGVVTGTGTIRIKATGSNQFIYPGGNYEGFAAADSGNVVFYGDVPGVLPTQTDYNNVLMIGDSERIKANVDWTINGNIRFEDGSVDNTEFNRTISLSGDWENNASSDLFAPGTGKLILFGDTTQAIKGDFSTKFGFIELNGSGPKNLEQDVIVEQGMIFGTSRVYLNDNDMVWKAGSTIGGTPSASSMVVVNGDGLLRREINATGSITFPIGDTTGTADYSPATINFTSGSFSNAAIEISVVNTLDLNCGGGNYIRRFWKVEMAGITSYAATGTFRYVDGDVVGNESQIFTLSRNIASTECQFGPATNTSTNTLSLTIGSNGFFITGGDAGAILPPTVQVSDIQFITVTSTTIEVIWDATAADGDGRIVLVREDDPISGAPVNNTFYSVDNNLSGSPDVIATDNFVVYDGSGNTFTLSGLDPNRRYYFSIFEYNTLGAAITYLTTSPPTANQRTKFVFELSFTGDRGWRMMAFPVENAAYNQIFNTSNNAGLITQGFTGSSNPLDSPNLLWYDETFEGTDNQRWRQPGNLTNTAVPGRGYMYYLFGQILSDVRYQSLPEIDDIEISVELFAQSDAPFDFNVTYTAEADTGWNLIGNPFAGDIDWDGPGWTKTNMMDAIYVWDPSLNAGIGGYLTWADQSGDAALGGVIPMGQAFWVKAEESPSLIASKDVLTTGATFFGKTIADGGTSAGTKTNSGVGGARATDPPPRTRRSDSNDTARDDSSADYIEPEPIIPLPPPMVVGTPTIELVLQNGSLSQSAHIVFKEHSSKGIERTDAYNLQPLSDTYVSISSMADGQKLSINALPRRFNSIMEIPIEIGGFHGGVSVSGTYQLSLGSFSEIPSSWSIEVVDRNSGARVFWKNAGDDILVTAGGDEIKLKTTPDPVTGEQYNSMDFDSDRNPRSVQSGVRHDFDLVYEREVRIQVPAPGERILMRPIQGTSRSRFMLRINPNGEFSDLPDRVTLWQNYPNPFNPTTNIQFGLPQEERVRVEVYDILGRRVVTLANQTFTAGVHTIQFNGQQYASGVYFVRLVAGNQIETRKMILLK